MARYKVNLSYDGTHFQGFQRLNRAGTLERSRTVQGVVEKALRSLEWQGETIYAAGRTDAGVHAFGQVAAFDLEWKHSTQALLKAMNANLPEDVAVTDVKFAPGDFHPRYDARARRYNYRILCQEVRNPLEERYAWRVWPPLDFVRLVQASRLLLGTHDFCAFGTSPKPGGSTIRTVYRAAWQFEGRYLVFDIVANAFLLHMVRRIVFFLMQIGHHHLSVDAENLFLPSPRWDEHEGLFDWSPLSKLKTLVVPRVHGLAPPHGLYLLEVYYDVLPNVNIIKG